ncbi:2-oxoacid:ferredoxin oxidoreductase subunit beta [Legionella londiniensis]|uniref:2-oxoglutarate ferredoxin oxidoreductase beta subunit n=1 Tax=Legionella londiniensis TaxID=45068 RepID=A0A0W0VQP0_9GAMM|nr:2-oxoacid:ferredoxin oxidoreductase subunit beta [Legionella londiniensis]KTD22405.1 2-oxoglutarate ferredoxin oxidoreductase beta subunit [Legionella londiniensis]STX93021.1 2-oxoglutarate ferredoxin oxidoreductase beta subunit [Legionella londiniensis]
MNNNMLQRKDFINNNEVRWCPGCGDYAVLAAIQRILPELGLPPEKHVFVSGIGCAGRLPYYLNTYGFHTIHGRATAVATGLKAMREDLSVWVITGDGDALSIGGNHLIHCLRRNVNINILLLNNQVYGLTKGQFSPTSKPGQITKTSPMGVNSMPINPLALALASGASFVARAVDKDPNHLAEVLRKAHEHPGCAFIEIYQDCHIFNPGAFDDFAVKANREKNTLMLAKGEHLFFGENHACALDLIGSSFQVVPAHEASYRHDPSNYLAATELARLKFGEFPVPLGIYYQEIRDVYQLKGEVKKTKEDMHALLCAKTSWNQV